MMYQIGNPLLEFNTDFNSRAEFLWSHGLISDATYNQFTVTCNYSSIRRQAASGGLSPVCSAVIRRVSSEISRFVDTYDVTLDVCLSSVELQSEVLNQLVSVVSSFRFHITNWGGFLISMVRFFVLFLSKMNRK